MENICKKEIALYYKDLSWVDRKSVLRITVWHHEACRVVPDCDNEGRILLSTPHTHDRFFFLHIFISERSFFNNAVISIVDVRHIVMALLWLLMTSFRSVT